MPLDIRVTGNREYGRWIKLLVCGEPGAGKTLFASTFPNVLYASAEGGMMSVANRHLPYIDIRKSDDLLSLKREILDRSPARREELVGRPVDTIVVDTVDEIQRILIRERLEADKKPAMQLQDWGWLGEQMAGILRGFRNLDMHVVFTCHLKETKDDENGRLFFKPGLSGAISDQIAGYVDLAFVLRGRTINVQENQKVTKRIVRALYSFPDPAYPWLKDRSGKLAAEFEVNFDDDYKRLEALIFGDIDEDWKHETGNETPVQEIELPPSKDITADEEPVPVVSPPAEAAVEVVEETPTESTFTCEACGTSFEDADQSDLSRIRYRKTLCKKCYTNFKK